MPRSPTHISPDRLLKRANNFARHDPTKAVATAFGFGFLLHLLPLRALASMFVFLLFTLARPVLLFLGVLKAFGLARTKSASGKHFSR